MSTRGPMQVSPSGLVFYYDTFNSKSYKGQPTTNVAVNPLDLFAWCTSGANAATLARDTSTSLSPAGGIPMKMTTTGNDPYTNTYASSPWNLAAAASGQTWTYSAWVKANRSLSVSLFLFEAASNGTYLTHNAQSYTATTEWQRVSITSTFSNASTAYVQARVDGPDSYTAGDVVWWDGLQVEQKSYATQFAAGTRTVTNGLVDLTENYTVNLTNAGYDSNANITFNGSSNYITAYTIPDSFWNAGSWSVSVWIKFNAVSKGSDNAIFGHGVASYSNGLHLAERNSVVYFGFYSNDLSGTIPLAANKWYNIVWVFNYSTKLKQIYVNGVFDTSGGSVGYSGTGTNTEFGRYPWSTGNLTNSTISSIYGYNKVLTASEVLQNYNRTKSRFGL
jgi:hypothetical protein